jgi:hypothetical protein
VTASQLLPVMVPLSAALPYQQTRLPVHLLECKLKLVAESGLAHLKHHTTHPHAGADVRVGGIWHYHLHDNLSGEFMLRARSGDRFENQSYGSSIIRLAFCTVS